MQINPNTSPTGTPNSSLNIEKKIANVSQETNVIVKMNVDSPAAVVTLGEKPVTPATYDNPVTKGLDEEKIRELKAQMDESTKNITSMFQKVLDDTLGQSLQFTLSNLDQLDFSQGKIMYQGKELLVDADTKVQAEEAISDTGFYGIENTAQRALEFAKALSGNNPEKATLLKDAVQKAYDQVSEMFGGKLPEITEKTHARTLELFEAWGKGEDTTAPPKANVAVATTIEVAVSQKTTLSSSSLDIQATPVK